MINPQNLNTNARSYAQALPAHTADGRVIVSAYSPLARGEKARNSVIATSWREVKGFAELTKTARYEAAYAFASIGYSVHIRPATYGGHARMWIKKNS